MRWLRSLLTPAEDPRAMREGGSELADLEAPGALLARLDASIAELAGARERLSATARHIREASGDDAVRRRALARVEEQLAAVAEQERDTRSVRGRLLAYAAELEARHAVVEARRRAAAAQVRVGEALAGLSDDLETVAEAVERAELRADALKARAAVLDQLGEAG
jgi:phage shock protein A